MSKEECSFLKKRTEKLLFVCARAVPPQANESLFVSFSSEKEDSSIPGFR
jgi:hypothetical protein